MTETAGAVEIVGSDRAARALSEFQAYPKLCSWLLLHVAGMPALPGLVVRDWSEATRNAVERFAERWPARSLLVRSDGAAETARSPRGGFVRPVHLLTEVVVPLLDDGRVVFLLEPVSPFDDLFSLSLGPAPTWGEWDVEIVGPGFDASDLKRGDVTPHESLVVRAADGRVEVMSRRVSSADEQAAARAVRFRKVAGLLGCEPSAVRDVLRERDETLLTDHPVYEPVPLRNLTEAIARAARLRSHLQPRDLPDQSVVISMSFIGSTARPVFWDVVWPSGKYRGTTTQLDRSDSSR